MPMLNARGGWVNRPEVRHHRPAPGRERCRCRCRYPRPPPLLLFLRTATGSLKVYQVQAVQAVPLRRLPLAASSQPFRCARPFLLAAGKGPSLGYCPGVALAYICGQTVIVGRLREWPAGQRAPHSAARALREHVPTTISCLFSSARALRMSHCSHLALRNHPAALRPVVRCLPPKRGGAGISR